MTTPRSEQETILSYDRELDQCGLYDCAWQAHNNYQRIIDYNREQLEVTDDEV